MINYYLIRRSTTDLYSLNGLLKQIFHKILLKKIFIIFRIVFHLRLSQYSNCTCTAFSESIFITELRLKFQIILE